MSRLDDVVITGLGTTSPLGGDTVSTWEALVAGRSGIRALADTWAERSPVRIAGTLAVEPSEKLERPRLRRLDRVQAMALIAAREAWNDSGLSGSGLEPERLVVTFGSALGGAGTTANELEALRTDGPDGVSFHAVPMMMPNGPAAWIALELGARGGAHTVVSACSTGSEAIALGLDVIRSGRADVAIAGGADALVHPLLFAAFARIRVMSTRNDEPAKASRPFDVSRDGFVMSEGAGIVILERATHAVARGARIYAKLGGAGITSDAHDIVSPDPTGAGAARAITIALRSAGVSRLDITHVNAHATSTKLGDLAEVAALRVALGDHAAVTALKSTIGHLFGAAGAVESIATILSIHHEIVPPTINLDTLDPSVDLDVVANKPRCLEIAAALKTSFGFGGHNVALVYQRFTPRRGARTAARRGHSNPVAGNGGSPVPGRSRR